MATLTVETIIKAGVQPVYSAVNSEDQFINPSNERTFLHVKNGGGGSINVTVVAQKTSAKVQGVGVVTIDNIVVAVPAADERMIGPFSDAYTDSDGLVTVQYSGTTSVTAQAIKLAADSL